mgnify:CR=1
KLLFSLILCLLCALPSQCNNGGIDDLHGERDVHGRSQKRRFLRFLELTSSPQQDKKIDGTLGRIQVSLEKLADDS